MSDNTISLIIIAQILNSNRSKLKPLPKNTSQITSEELEKLFKSSTLLKNTKDKS